MMAHRANTQKNTLMHTYTRLLAVFFMAKQMVKWLRQRRQHRNSQRQKNNLTSETVNVSKNPAKQIVQIIKSMMEYP